MGYQIIKDYRAKTMETAEKANLFYVLCIFKSPISGIETRVAYFEDAEEASIFFQQLVKLYTTLAYEFEVTSNTGRCSYRTPNFFEEVELNEIEMKVTVS